MREHQLQEWLKSQGIAPSSWQPLAGDASFRRYFRLQNDTQQLIAVDSPPDREPCDAFIALASTFKQAGLTVPDILAADKKKGFLLLTDMGEQHYLDALNTQTADTLYSRALDELMILKECQSLPSYTLPIFDRTMMQAELTQFKTWGLEKHMGLSLTSAQKHLLEKTFDALIHSAESQPLVCIHRDYHSANLMVLPNHHVGILDFQDACMGPLVYDVVSLLRDCYIDWPLAQVQTWALSYYDRLILEGKNNISRENYLRWFDWMGLQRHLKAIYIFSRKYHRDQNPHYLKHIPRTLRYVDEVCSRYPELEDFRCFLKKNWAC